MELNILIGIYVFVFGNIFGSFFNVCIYRIPRGESIITPPSHCPNCNYVIKWYDNIPIISYFILLRGKCRKCGCKINVRYPLIEMLTGLLFLVVYIVYGYNILTIKYIIFVSFLIILSFIDMEKYILPDVLTLPMIFLGLGFSFFSEISIYQSLLGILAYSSVFLILFAVGEYIIKKDVMGFGDVKLGAAIGAFLGYTDFYRVHLFFMIAFCSGAFIGIIMILLKKKSKKDLIPFGPFIALSGFATLIYSEIMYKWVF